MTFRQFTKLPLLLFGLAAAAGLAAYPSMPERIPLHWGLSGAIDRWGVKSLGHVLLMPGLILGIYLLMLVAPRFDPRGANVIRSPRAYMLLTDVIAAFFAFMQFLLIASAYNPAFQTSRLIFGGVGVLFVVIGNYMPQLPSNWTAGVRMPWTLDDPEVWKKANRLGGVLFVVDGLVIIVAAFLPPAVGAIVLLGSVLVMVAVLYGYSFVQYRRRHESAMPQ